MLRQKKDAKNFHKIWLVSKTSGLTKNGRFPVSLESFQTNGKVYRQPGKFPDNP